MWFPVDSKITMCVAKLQRLYYLKEGTNAAIVFGSKAFSITVYASKDKTVAIAEFHWVDFSRIAQHIQPSAFVGWGHCDPVALVWATNQELQVWKKKARWENGRSQRPSAIFRVMKCSTFEEGRSQLWLYLLCLCILFLPVENKGTSLSLFTFLGEAYEGCVWTLAVWC